MPTRRRTMAQMYKSIITHISTTFVRQVRPSDEKPSLVQRPDPTSRRQVKLEKTPVLSKPLQPSDYLIVLERRGWILQIPPLIGFAGEGVVPGMAE